MRQELDRGSTHLEICKALNKAGKKVQLLETSLVACQLLNYLFSGTEGIMEMQTGKWSVSVSVCLLTRGDMQYCQTGQKR